MSKGIQDEVESSKEVAPPQTGPKRVSWDQRPRSILPDPLRSRQDVLGQASQALRDFRASPASSAKGSASTLLGQVGEYSQQP